MDKTATLKTILRMTRDAYEETGACQTAQILMQGLPDDIPAPAIDFSEDNSVVLEWTDSPQSRSFLRLCVTYEGKVEVTMAVDRQLVLNESRWQRSVRFFLAEQTVSRYFSELSQMKQSRGDAEWIT